MYGAGVDRDLLARAYDRSAYGYDDRFRALQREKYRAAAALLEEFPPPAGDVLDAGCGTGLFSEWLADPAEAFTEMRGALRAGRLVVLDASLGMLRHARPRAPLCVAADLMRPPFRPAGFALVVAFTSILGEPRQALRTLATLLAPDGELLATFLAAEASAAERGFPTAGLQPVFAGIPAGQDRAFLLQRHGAV
jgi:SAM-dependent methyltransferase